MYGFKFDERIGKIDKLNILVSICIKMLRGG